MKLQISALSFAIIAATGLAGAAHAAEPKGVLPSYPDCSSKTGEAKQTCMETAKRESTGTESPVNGSKRAQGVAPKYPKPLAAGNAGSDNAAAGAASGAGTKGVAPKYPKVVTDHRSKDAGSATGGSVSMTAAGGSGEPGAKGVAPKFPGKPVATKGQAADTAPDKVKVNGVAPKFPKMKEAKDATAGSLEPKSSVKSKGVAPKYPKSE